MHHKPFPNQYSFCLALRANPFPEVTDLICRLPLPTLLTRGYSPWRPDAVMSTNNRSYVEIEFSRTADTAPELPTSRNLYQTTILLANWIYSKDCHLLTRKDNSSQEYHQCLQSQYRYRHTSIGSGILTWFPFDRRWPTSSFQWISPIS